MLKKSSVIICVTDGIEDIETITCIDILTRSNINVLVASTTKKYNIRCAYGTHLMSNVLLKDLKINKNHAAIILPGGLQAAEHFATNNLLLSILKTFKKNKAIIGAICASPSIVLIKNNIFPTAKMTGFLGLKNLIPYQQWSKNSVYWDDINKLLTAQSVKYAISFNLKLIDIILGPQIAQKIQLLL
ncbi:DJ-1 family glyoxalase III [Enterobacteriaceae endosymbiont of Neohaemonia nigricornis]|uniref:DJ-1 family glyoxalase III n=1 Tax=Enterobacteriaceae endosymbiont of Neohaemonia nigricornis TaxID=2675792 RepID=UPI001448CC20|nr:DJ-1 family glyoxalase III [Enterobacteriaceae endosymbiont of Neohaemonia nigricornis]QJC30249.1 DJ-1 family protein [Enterobacteriaceae endosymbiont of Neohaemonia nigricornis]